MTKVVKSISLDEQTAPLANEKSNFSAWVRQQLLDEIQYTIPCVYFKVKIPGKKVWNETFEKWGKEPDKEIEEICNGQKKTSCKKCFPHGPPEREDWLAYANGRITGKELLSRAENTWKWRTDQIEKNKDSKNQEKEAFTPHLRQRKAYVRRLLSWIWSYIW